MDESGCNGCEATAGFQTTNSGNLETLLNLILSEKAGINL
jgi:hypothetical protein